MEKHNLYLVSLAALMLGSTVSLAALNETRLDVYLSIFTISYFIASAIFNPRRRWKDFIGAALFLIFACIVALRVLEILVR